MRILPQRRSGAADRRRRYQPQAVCGLLLGLAAGSASAAEFVVRDLRLALDLLPVDFEVTVADDAGSRQGEDQFRSAIGTRVAGLYSFSSPGASGAWIIGFEGRLANWTYDPGTMQVLSGHVLAGYGYAWTQDWSSELLAYGGLGLGTMDIDDNIWFSGERLSGLGSEYGLRASIAYRLSHTLSLALEGGYEFGDYALDGDDFDLDLASSGASVGFSLTWRLGDTPDRLD